jgi:hypothetical protein
MLCRIMDRHGLNTRKIGFARTTGTLLLAAVPAFIAAPTASAGNYTDWYRGSFIALRSDGYAPSKINEPVNGEDWGSIYTSELDFFAYNDWDLGERGSRTWLLLDYGMLILEYDELRDAGEYSFDHTMHGTLRWGGLWKTDGAYGLRGVIAPGFSSDFNDADWSRAFTPEAELHMMWFPGSGWETGIGAVYTYDTGLPRVLPSIIAAKETERYRVDAFLPHCADIFYKPGHGFEFGLAWEMWGHLYARDGSDFPQFEDPALSSSVSSFGGGIGYWFDRILYMRLDIGYLLGRRLRYMNGDDDILVLDPENSVYVKVFAITGKY